MGIKGLLFKGAKLRETHMILATQLVSLEIFSDDRSWICSRSEVRREGLVRSISVSCERESERFRSDCVAADGMQVVCLLLVPTQETLLGFIASHKSCPNSK